MLINILIVIAIVVFLLWVVNSQIPMEDTLRELLNIVVIIALVVYVLKAFGLLSSVGEPLRTELFDQLQQDIDRLESMGLLEDHSGVVCVTVKDEESFH